LRRVDRAKEESAMAALVVKSSAFEHEQRIPAKYTCDGQDISPPLEWSAGPEGTKGYALIADDPDAPGGTWTHWVAWNIRGTGVGEGAAPDGKLKDGTCQGKNSWGRTGYGGPCPPSGTHRYYFRVFALDRALELPERTDAKALTKAIEGRVLARGQLMGRYSRGG
jgi:hypothetical protein